MVYVDLLSWEMNILLNNFGCEMVYVDLLSWEMNILLNNIAVKCVCRLTQLRNEHFAK